jgi:hypothetical protein
MHDLLERFLSVEENFKLGGPEGPSTEQEAIDKLRKVGEGMNFDKSAPDIRLILILRKNKGGRVD